LFTGDLDNQRTVAWACRTPSCPAVTRRQHGRCDVCRRAQAASAAADEDFDREPRRALFYANRSSLVDDKAARQVVAEADAD
jgi:hypothetical protein